MSGSVEGGRKAAAANKLKHGEDFFKRIGAIGGSASTDMPKGFAAVSPAKRSAAGRKGGTISRKRSSPDEVRDDVRDIWNDPVYREQRAARSRESYRKRREATKTITYATNKKAKLMLDEATS